MNFKTNDIILVKFPFSDLRNTKIRPALVIKSLEGENIILCQITTQKRNLCKYEINLSKKSCKGNIRFDSNIYLDMIFTLHKSLIVAKLGEVKKDSVKQEIKNKLKEMFCSNQTPKSL